MANLEIRVEPRLLRIGSSEVYQISNIARITIKREISRRPWRECVMAAAVAFAGLTVMGLVPAFGLLLLAGGGGVLALYLLNAGFRSPLYYLVVEAGVARGVFANPSLKPIREAMNLIVAAISDPPAETQVTMVYGDWVEGDKVSQAGTGNVYGAAAVFDRMPGATTGPA